MPKLPPPPRIAQNRSGFSSALARTSFPSAVTTSADRRLSAVSPYLRLIQPNPPPSVRPAIPVVELMPVGVTSPKACASRSNSPSVTPGSTRAVLANGSMRTDFIGVRSIITPPSHDGAAGDVVAAAANGEHRPRLAREIDGGAHVSRPGAAHDQAGAPVDHGIPYRAGRVVPIIAVDENGAAHPPFQRRDRLFGQAGRAAGELCQG